jgi:hydrogenase nickel incorporation protein HypA/HybF
MAVEEIAVHELSVALSLVEVAEEAARRAEAERVTVVRLELGTLSGVHADALRFGYEVAVRGTLLEGSDLVIDSVPAAIACHVCGETSEVEALWPFQCPRCGAPCANLVRGKELQILDLEIEP